MLAITLLLASALAMADTFVETQVLFPGANVYGASILNEGVYSMWYSAWQDSNTHNDTIYYRQSSDNVNWGDFTVVYTTQNLEDSYTGPRDIKGRVIHVTDQSCRIQTHEFSIT